MKSAGDRIKTRDGFTLVEIIVVLVILAILAATAIPLMTGFVQQAKDQGLISEARAAYAACQSAAVKAVAQGENPDSYVGGQYDGNPTGAGGNWLEAIAPYISAKRFYFAAVCEEGSVRRIVYSEDGMRYAHINLETGQAWVDADKDVNKVPDS